jgi:hypothetical protein
MNEPTRQQCSEVADKLNPAEEIAFRIAWDQVAGGRPTGQNTVAMLLMTIERLAGGRDWTAESDVES